MTSTRLPCLLRAATVAVLLLAVWIFGGAVLAAEEPIKIGAPANLTGALSSLDTPALNGARLKVKEINEGGGVLGHRLELVVYDGKTDPTTIASIGSQLVHSDRVPVIMGFTDSDSVLALGPIAEQAGIPFITPGATSPKLPDQVGKDMFLACFGDNVQAAAGAEFLLNRLNARTVYLLSDNATEYTTLLADYFKQAYQHGGGRIALEDNYKSGDTSFTAQITRLKALSLRPDALYIAAMPDDIGLIVKQMRQAGVAGPIVGGDGYDTPLLLSVGGAAADNVYYSTHAFMSPEGPPSIRTFYTVYQQAYGTPPENAFAALGFDAVGLIAQAIEKAGSDDPAKIRDALAATHNYQGVTGTVAYRPGLQVPDKTVWMIEIRNQTPFQAAEVTPNWVPSP